ncbi:MAG: aldolase catalytic domain-containing protein [Candidatus Parabeggiatoa sp.]|nr:aldolase catalytic domain-containing protein [Candidatus Parabeggiatoa sp.]HIE01108.1 nucleoid-structuring protein H-NS [Thiotrichaceae bacterium]
MSHLTKVKEWLSYRPDLKVVDCTIRDGGLMNNSQFDDAVVKAVYEACLEAGVDYMEIGYKASKKIFAPSQYGPWRHCNEDDLRRIIGENDTNLKIAVMADAEKTDYKTDILPRDNSVIDMIRVATYIHQLPIAIDMIKDAHDKGYETTANIMAISVAAEHELFEGLELLAESEVDAIYVVDSFGHLYSEQVRFFVQKYLEYMSDSGKTVGIHAHNNLQLAFANTIEAIAIGANMVDATIGGLGRGAGNCQMELLLGFLHNPKFNIRPILKCLQEHIEPMRAELGWGFDIPYLVTGMLNMHPQTAIEYQASEQSKDYIAFYDSTIQNL